MDNDDGLGLALVRTLLAQEHTLQRDNYEKGETTAMTERDAEMKWMCAVARQEQLGLDTLALGVALLDTTLSVSRVQKKYLNCAALASLYIAVKICEELDSVPDIGQLLRRLHSPYSTRELMRMEIAILSRLKWHLSLPTVHRFLHVLICAGGLPLSLEHELRPSVETILAHGAVTTVFPASVVALSLLSVTLEVQRLPTWLTITVGLQRLLETDQTTLIACREAVGIALGIDDKENIIGDAQSKTTTSPKRAKKARKRHRLSSKSAEGKKGRVKSVDEHFEIAEALLVLYG